MTHGDESDKESSNVKDQEDSDYQMALMLSQQECNIQSEEEKHRIDREKADYQMALKLSQDENIIFPPEEHNYETEVSTGTNSCRGMTEILHENHQYPSLSKPFYEIYMEFVIASTCTYF